MHFGKIAAARGFTAPQIHAWANILVKYSTGVQPGNLVKVWFQEGAQPLAKACMDVAYQSGALRVDYFMAHQVLDGLQFDHLSPEALAVQHPHELAGASPYDVNIRIRCDNNPFLLGTKDPMKVAARAKGAELINDKIMSTRWVLTDFPTPATAKIAKLNYEDLASFMITAMRLDSVDPVAEWLEVSSQQERLIAFLKDKNVIRIVTDHDNEMTIGIKGRLWENCDGKKNFPDGEVFTAPELHSANGSIYFTYPSFRDGRIVEDVRLCLENGKIIEASSKTHEDYLLAQLNTDEGARFFGETAFGTSILNRAILNTLYDEKLKGMHFAAGKAIPSSVPEGEAGNKSAIHWDFITKPEAVYVDGALIFTKEGGYQIPQ